MVNAKADLSSAYGIDVLNDLFRRDKDFVPILIYTNAHDH